MLACSRLGDQAFFPHAFCQQCLPERVVELMGSSMNKVFPLQVDPAPEFLRHVRAERKRCFAAGVFCLQSPKVTNKSMVFFYLLIRDLQFNECAHERL